MSVFKFFASLLLIQSLVHPVYAQDPATTLQVSKPAGFQIEDLGLLISRAISVALVVAGILVFIYLVWGGIQWITSGGDKAKTEEARSRITAAIVGIAIVASAWAAAMLINYFFGLNIMDATILPGYAQ